MAKYYRLSWNFKQHVVRLNQTLVCLIPQCRSLEQQEHRHPTQTSQSTFLFLFLVLEARYPKSYFPNTTVCASWLSLAQPKIQHVGITSIPAAESIQNRIAKVIRSRITRTQEVNKTCCVSFFFSFLILNFPQANRAEAQQKYDVFWTSGSFWLAEILFAFFPVPLRTLFPHWPLLHAFYSLIYVHRQAEQKQLANYANESISYDSFGSSLHQ